MQKKGNQLLFRLCLNLHYIIKKGYITSIKGPPKNTLGAKATRCNRVLSRNLTYHTWLYTNKSNINMSIKLVLENYTLVFSFWWQIQVTQWWKQWVCSRNTVSERKILFCWIFFALHKVRIAELLIGCFLVMTNSCNSFLWLAFDLKFLDQ